MSEALKGLRVLVLEDEALVSMLLEGMLEDLGCTVVGPFARLNPAMAFVQNNPGAIDAALLDINVAGERSLPLAEALSQAGVPYAFCTGYDSAGIDPAFRAAPRLSKPYLADDVEKALKAIRR
ncbi:MAG: response regulator [Hyphomonadaceae bacterium]